LQRTYSNISKNKMLIGFGISKPEIVKSFAPYCDGVIVGSAIVKTLMTEKAESGNFEETIKLVSELKEACRY